MWRKFKETFPYYRNNIKHYESKEIIFADKRYTIRQMEVGDIKDLIQLQRVVYHGEIPWTRSAFLSELWTKYPHLYLCLLDEDRLIAFVGVRVDGEDGHLTNVAVHPSYQGQGIGTNLIIEAEKFAIRTHCQTMSLEVRKSNLDAQRLYRRLNFESRRILPAYYSETNEDAVDMVKRLIR